MKKLIIALLVLIQLGANAQNKEEKGKFREEMQAALKLTADQSAQMKAIHQASKKAHEENKVKYATDKKALHQANQALRKETEAKIKAILSPDQYATMVKMKEEKRSEKVLKRANETSTKLGLSAEQNTKFLGFVATREQKMKANYTQFANDPEKLKEANKTAMKEFKDQVKSILSKEQLEKMKELKKMNHEHPKH